MLKVFTFLIAAGISHAAWSDESDSANSGTANIRVEALDESGLAQEYSALSALFGANAGVMQPMRNGEGGGSGHDGGHSGGGGGYGGGGHNGSGGAGGDNSGHHGGGSDHYGSHPNPYPHHPNGYHVCFARNRRGVVYRAQGWGYINAVQRAAVNGCARHSGLRCVPMGCRR